MDSFVLAETFKYLYLLFEEEENLSIDLSQYIFTTEAHILPLSLANHTATAAGGSDTASRNKVCHPLFEPNTILEGNDSFGFEDLLLMNRQRVLKTNL